MQNAAHAYLKTQVGTTTQGSLLIMLYDGAIKFLNQAKEKIEARDYAAKGILISKAIDIVAELDGSLNANKGGELADNLHKLYFYCNARLLKANLDLDLKLIDEVIDILDGLRSAFQEVIDSGETGAATAPISSRDMRPGPSTAGLNAHSFGAPAPGQAAPRPNPALMGKMPAAYASQAAAANNVAAQEKATAKPQAQQNAATSAPASPSAAAPPQKPQTPPAAQQEPDQAQNPAPSSPGLTPSPLLGARRLSGASMYKKMASTNDQS